MGPSARPRQAGESLSVALMERPLKRLHGHTERPPHVGFPGLHAVAGPDGIALWKCTNCGAKPNWAQVGGTTHFDYRAVTWTGNRLIIGSDGGVYSTSDGG